MSIQQEDMDRAIESMTNQIGKLLHKHSDEILKGYESAGEELLKISLLATFKGGSGKLTRKVSLNFATEKVADSSSESTNLDQSEMNFQEQTEEDGNEETPPEFAETS